METYPLPEGYTSRAATWDDVKAVADLVIACDIAEFGEPDFDEEDVRSDWTRARFDIARDTWLVHDESGAPRGYALAWEKQLGREFEADFWVDPTWPFAPLGPWLEQRIAERTRAAAREAGAPVEVRVWNSVANPTRTALLESTGYRYLRTFRRMEVDCGDEPPPAPVLPDGVTLRRYAGPADAPVVHELSEATFADHFGHVPEPYAEWYPRVVESPTFVPELTYIVEVDGAPGAVMVNQRHDDKGWIRTLGVLKQHRGRGIAKALMSEAFRAFHAEGYRKVALGVDSDNATGAMGLYENCGMRATLQFDNYGRVVEPD